MTRIFGIDAGIASIGWAVTELDDDPAQPHPTGQIIACGSRMFDAPETDKERKPTNQIRRAFRGQRRVIRRRAQRAAAIRHLFAASGLIPDAGKNALALKLDPWELRAQALDRPLSGLELAAALGHIAIHRGFRSNAKPDSRKNTAEESAMKQGIAAIQERLAKYRTVGEMFARDPEFAARKRNRDGNFTHSILRADQEAEVAKIFAAQHRLGNALATDALEHAYAEAAFSQRPLQDSHHLVGDCPFVQGQKRAARRAPSFELFRLLSRLNAIRIQSGRSERPLTPEEIATITQDFGARKSLSWKWLRKRLRLPENHGFAGIKPDEEKPDFVARAGAAAEGTYALRQALGDAAWPEIAPETLDQLAEILTFRSDLASIETGIRDLIANPAIASALVEAARAGKFSAFAGAGHISAAAARALLPHLAQGLVYSEACARAGFDHAAQPEIRLADIRNPIARKAATEVLKQVKTLVHIYGLPDRMHIELARDLGKSTEERSEIASGINKANKRRDANRDSFRDQFKRDPSADDLLKYELWQEQGGFCLYSGREISPELLDSGSNDLQIDHILPWSRFGDDSFINKTLCFTRANAEKRGRTPYEWFTATKDEADWDLFQARVDSCKSMKSAKRRGFYLRRNAEEVEEKFRNRNLTDTRYACRLVLGLLTQSFYPGRTTRHVLARPGALTAKLRRGWGLEALKKDTEGKRLADDRHHALDAIILAACSESMVNRLTRAFQQAEARGTGRDFARLDPPWEGFREQTIAAVDAVFVSRAERHRARGKAHDATIKQIRKIDGKPVVFERKRIDKLTEADLARIDNPERNAPIIKSLRAWIEAGKPMQEESLPRSPKGDIIRKIRLATTDKVAVELRGGTADRGDMARVDVFEKSNEKGKRQYFLVPIYPHQIATQNTPPNRAVNAHKPEGEWELMDGSFTFRFSLYRHSFVEVTKPDGVIISGYYKGLDVSGGMIALANHKNLDDRNRGIGTRNLLAIRKFAVDRLGAIAEITQETRTWRGEPCI